MARNVFVNKLLFFSFVRLISESSSSGSIFFSVSFVKLVLFVNVNELRDGSNYGKYQQHHRWQIEWKLILMKKKSSNAFWVPSLGGKLCAIQRPHYDNWGQSTLSGINKVIAACTFRLRHSMKKSEFWKKRGHEQILSQHHVPPSSRLPVASSSIDQWEGDGESSRKPPGGL